MLSSARALFLNSLMRRSPSTLAAAPVAQKTFMTLQNNSFHTAMRQMTMVSRSPLMRSLQTFRASPAASMNILSCYRTFFTLNRLAMRKPQQMLPL